MRRLTFEYVFNYFEERNCKLLATEYVNSKIKVPYICECGNQSEISFCNFRNGHRCIKCGGNEKPTFEYVFNYFEKHDCKLLAKDYVNSHTKMPYICECGNKAEIRFNDFKGGYRCTKCGGKEKIYI